MSYDVLHEIRCQCGHLKTDHLWSMHGKVKRCQKKKCHCLKFIERTQARAGGGGGRRTMKGERWEKIVEKVAIDGWSGDAYAVGVQDAVKLLRRQHAAMVRMVKKIRDRATVSQFLIASQCTAYREACDDILAALAKERQP